MHAAQSQLIHQAFNNVTISWPKVWTKALAIEAVRRFLTEDLPYPEAEEALSWLEDEYPTSRQVIRRLRCCIMFEEFFEYEQQVAAYATCLRQLRVRLL